jgi:hypothetical protein
MSSGNFLVEGIHFHSTFLVSHVAGGLLGVCVVSVALGGPFCLTLCHVINLCLNSRGAVKLFISFLKSFFEYDWNIK